MTPRDDRSPLAEWLADSLADWIDTGLIYARVLLAELAERLRPEPLLKPSGRRPARRAGRRPIRRYDRALPAQPLPMEPELRRPVRPRAAVARRGTFAPLRDAYVIRGQPYAARREAPEQAHETGSAIINESVASNRGAFVNHYDEGVPDGMAQNPRVPLRTSRARPRRRTVLPGWVLGSLVGVFVLATLLSAYLVFATVRDFVAGWRMTGDNPATPVAEVGGGDPNNDGNGTGGGQDPAATPRPEASEPVPTVSAQAWTGTDRVTILVMGIDRRVGEDEKGYLTDTMLLVTMDPVAKTAAMLSIPRDLWVEIPGFGEDTINTANRSGDYYDYPGGGPALAVKTVQHNLGVTVNYYVRLDFTAFETFIDTIGGIDIYNETEIDDPYYPNGSYGYDPFYLPAGQHHLNGYDALRYARTRHGNSDIDRANRQQQVVMAVRERVLSLNMLPTLITQAPLLYRTLNESVWTDLTLEQMVSLALLAKDIPRENIRSAVIDYEYVLDYETAEGRQVLVPLRDKIRELRDELFASTAATAPITTQDDPAIIAAEAARIEVLNGAGVEGLACATRDWLVTQGLQAIDCNTADRSDYLSTVIVVYSGKPYTVGWLQRTFGVSTIINSISEQSDVDIKVIVGQDWQIPQGTGQ